MCACVLALGASSGLQNVIASGACGVHPNIFTAKKKERSISLLFSTQPKMKRFSPDAACSDGLIRVALSSQETNTTLSSTGATVVSVSSMFSLIPQCFTASTNAPLHKSPADSTQMYTLHPQSTVSGLFLD